MRLKRCRFILLAMGLCSVMAACAETENTDSGRVVFGDMATSESDSGAGGPVDEDADSDVSAPDAAVPVSVDTGVVEDVSPASSCSDGVQNGSEEGLDCGGPCMPCVAPPECLDGPDCPSGVCVDGVCQMPRCDDGVINGTESDLDCGGAGCPGCEADALCNADADCQSGLCAERICQAPRCDDGLLNGDEWGVDCGPSCETCDLNALSCERIDSVWPADWVLIEEDMLRFGNIARGQVTNCDTEGIFQPTQPLVMNEQLRCAARRHSFDMAVRNYFSHSTPEGTGPGVRVDAVNYRFRRWGENIHAGRHGRGERAIDEWVESDAHCRNLMQSDFTEIGLGYAFQEGSTYQGYFTQVFGTPR